MPKGETSRPYNRKEKKAVKTQKTLKKSGMPPSQAFKVGAQASKTLTDRKEKEKRRGLNTRLGKIGAQSKKKK